MLNYMTKRLDQFVKDYSGKFIEEVDSVALNQCKDLVQRYIKEVWGLAYLPFGNAYNMFAKAQNDLYNKVINSYFSVPQVGDVIVWGTRYGQYGHIGVVTSANLFWFNSFEQNDPLRSPSHIKRYSYSGVTGWFRPKVIKMTDETIKSLYRKYWKREPAFGDWMYYKNRKDYEISLEDTMKFQAGKYYLLESRKKGDGDKWLQAEKAKYV